MSDPVLQRNRRIERFYFRRDRERSKPNWEKILKISGKALKWTLIILGLILYEMIMIPIAIVLVPSTFFGSLILPAIPFILYTKLEERKFKRYLKDLRKEHNKYPDTPDDPIDHDQFWNSWDYFDSERDWTAYVADH